MEIALTVICVTALVTTILVRRVVDQRELERHTITPGDLHALLVSNRELAIVDVRQPLDLLGDSVIIAGAEWLAPRQVLDDPSLIPRGVDVVVYCTCPSDKNSLAVLQRALAMGISRVKILKGGLDAWRAQGYPVEPYEKSFHLDSDQEDHFAAAS